MKIRKFFGIFIVLLFVVMLSCDEEDNDSSLLPFAAVNTSSSDGVSDDTTNPVINPTDPGTDGDTGGTDVPIIPGLDDVKNILDDLLQEIISAGFVFSINPACMPMGFDFIDNDTLTVHKQITCDPSTLVMTITMREYRVEGFDCLLNGVIVATVHPTGTLGSYLINIATPADSPVTTTGSPCCSSSIALSNLVLSVTLQPFSALYSGTVLINGQQQSLSEFTVPSDLMDLLEETLADVLGWLGGLL